MRNKGIILLIGLIGIAVIVGILMIRHLKPQNDVLSKVVQEEVEKETIGETESTDNKPMASYPAPIISSLSDEPQLCKDGHPPQTIRQLEAAVGIALKTGGGGDFALGKENAILRLQVVQPETGEVVKTENFWHFGISGLAEKKTEFGPVGEKSRNPTMGFSSSKDRLLTYYFIIAKDFYAGRYGNVDILIKPGRRYYFTGETPEKDKAFYSEFTIPADVKPGTCITFNIPTGVGIHPNLRPKKRLRVKIGPDLKPPVKADKWLALYHRYSEHDRATFNSNLRQATFEKDNYVADLGSVKPGEALTVTNSDKTLTWMYVKQVSGFNVQLPRDADFVLKDRRNLREVSVVIPSLLGHGGRQPKNLEIGITNNGTFIPLSRAVLYEQVIPKGAFKSEDRRLKTVTLRWLPGTYKVVIRGNPYGGISDEVMGNLSLEQRMDMPRISLFRLTLATGTLTIPETSTDNSTLQIDDLELTDLAEYMKPLNLRKN
ncbi:MAG: hypothetical protein RRC34_01795 [Lentisphaeria bacterium]|nr:hypothetical protein [Lentisphaeria bacterium]